MIKVMSFNINGIRAGARKGFFNWITAVNPDVICLQETKAQKSQLLDPIFHPEGYESYYVDAEKKGYSGVAVFSKQSPLAVHKQLDWLPADREGRYLQLDFKNISIASLYLPSGTSGDERQQFKYAFLDFYFARLQSQLTHPREYILCGDWNIAHQAIDLKNWRANQKNSGFLPEERAWLDKLFKLGYIDAFRVVKQQADQYTWWSNRGRAWDNNVGWRIDYHIVTPGLKTKIIDTDIYKAERFSDHAPLTLTYNLEL